MSACAHPNDPPTTPSRANDGSRELSGDPGTSATVPFTTPVKPKGSAPHKRTGILEYEQVKHTPTDAEFLKNHLQPAPPDVFDQTTKAMIDQDVVAIMKVKNYEKPIYAPLASLLTAMSKTLYNTLNVCQKAAIHKRNRVPLDRPGHLTFIDHHAAPPTQFPEHALTNCCDVQDKPDLIAVYNFEDFGNKLAPTHGYDIHQLYSGIPHYRVEAIVEAKALEKGYGREQLITYLYRHHQARPDHPGIFGLTAGPEGYQVIFSDPNGVVASLETPWNDLNLLASYVYTNYCPPARHFLWDDTIRWVPGAIVTDTPTLELKIQNRWYTNADFVFLAEPWGRRTTILRANDEDSQQIIIKEMYRENRLFKEEAILEKIHRDDEMLGAVRMQGWEEVCSGGQIIECAGGKKRRTKVRLALLDSGVSLFQARSLNDLLKAIYDALEVHRTMYNERKVMHRDMSFHNILMYPNLGNSTRPLPQKGTAFIENILRGCQPKKPVFPTCLVIDFDHAADLEADGSGDILKERTGTPSFIARSVSLGRVFDTPSTFLGKPMPLLEGHALELYQAVHGIERYEKYNDEIGTQNQTVHGGYAPTRHIQEYTLEDIPAFSHRPEYDVESIYWAMVYTLLHVHPNVPDVPGETKISQAMQTTREILLSHYIPEHGAISSCESRGHILDYAQWQWEAHFCDKMQDVAVLLWHISRHVRSEYALWEGQLRPDHLHEALQRLILQYLVDHRDNDITFKQKSSRPIPNALGSPTEAKSRTCSINAPGCLSPKVSNACGVQQERLSGGTRRRTGAKGASVGTLTANARINDAAAGSQNQSSVPVRTSSKRKSEDSDKPSETIGRRKRRKTSNGPGCSSSRDIGGEGGPMVARAGRDQSWLPGRKSSKRKSDDSDTPPSEGLRRSKRLKANGHMGDTSDVGGSGDIAENDGPRRDHGRGRNRKDASGSSGRRTAIKGSSGATNLPQSSVPPRTRSIAKRKTTDSGAPSTGIRSSQRLKDAAAKKEAEKKDAARNDIAKRSARRTRRV